MMERGKIVVDLEAHIIEHPHTDFRQDAKNIITKNIMTRYIEQGKLVDLWETNSFEGKFSAWCGEQILEQMFPRGFARDLKVWEYGKLGLAIEGNSAQGDEYLIAELLPACKRFYERDWDRAGVCVRKNDRWCDYRNE